MLIMIKKILGLESPIIEKINKKYGKDVAMGWKISNLSIRLTVIGLVLAILMLVITVASTGGMIRNVLPITALFVLSLAGFGLIIFCIATAYVAYKMNEMFWAILCIVGIVISILLVVPVFFKYMKTEELKKL
jgi:uncharacterized membrane protein